MLCENCSADHNGIFGSGRFCCMKCARGFSTKMNRESISKKVSETHKARGITFSKRGPSPWLNPDIRTRAAKKKAENFLNSLASRPFETWSKAYRYKHIYAKQNGKCECGLGESWEGKPLRLQLDHVNGNNQDNREINLRLLCPNCHSQTETYCGRNKLSMRSPRESNPDKPI